MVSSKKKVSVKRRKRGPEKIKIMKKGWIEQVMNIAEASLSRKNKTKKR